MELLFWGIVIIFSTSITAIVTVLGIYYMITKTKLRSEGNKSKKQIYKLDNQKEIK